MEVWEGRLLFPVVLVRLAAAVLHCAEAVVDHLMAAV
jgi:hypothetical protein